MAQADLQSPAFTDENAAREAMEAVLWPHGPRCPRCESLDRITRVTGGRAGLYRCGACKRQFTVTVGTIFERSKVPLSKWWLAVHLMASSKKGVSAHQIHRMLGVTYETAWFMEHRIREAMAPGDNGPKLGGDGLIVESDETELAPSRKTKGARERKNNKKFMVLIERGGAARSKMITAADTTEIKGAIAKYVDENSILHTDGANVYKGAWMVKAHEAVDHNKEYARNGETGRVHVNSAEGFFSLFKRGLVGIYQHMSEHHLPRYLAEFDFRYTNRIRLGVDDAERAARIVRGASGKRLMYRRPDGEAAA